jgi:hypothetical protein
VDLDIIPRPEYKALSYTWGPSVAAASREVDPDKRWPIKIDRSICFVRENLYDCLSHFSLNSEWQGNFWIDAICINQANNDERNKQVNMMAQIYQSACVVVMWLGREDEETERACSGLTLLSQEKQLLVRSMAGQRVSHVAPTIVTEYIDALSKFLQRSWFMRAWVIQELLLAQKTRFICGQHEPTWEDIASVSGFLTISKWKTAFGRVVFSSISAPARLNAAKRTFDQGHEDDLLYHLIRSRTFRAEDPRDKVYSLLGLVQVKERRGSNKSTLSADYSLTPTETYVATAVHILKTSSSLLLLGHAEGEDYQELRPLPSWVPDWSVSVSVGLGITGYRRFEASGDLPRRFNLREEERILELTGVLLDTVADVGDSKTDFDAETHTAAGILPRWFDILESLDPVYHTGMNTEEVFWRTLITDTAGVPPQSPASPELSASFNKWLLQMLIGTVKTARSKVDAEADLPETLLAGLATLDRLAERPAAAGIIPTSKEILSFLDQNITNDFPQHKYTSNDFETTYSQSPNQRLFRTRRGYLGLGTTSMRNGDTVWIMPGSRIPLIFRKLDLPHRYKLVGGAYVHGFMRREAVVSGPSEFVTIEVE